MTNPYREPGAVKQTLAAKLKQTAHSGQTSEAVTALYKQCVGRLSEISVEGGLTGTVTVEKRRETSRSVFTLRVKHVADKLAADGFRIKTTPYDSVFTSMDIEADWRAA